MNLHASLNRVLWIGGAQWSGKTSVAQLLAVRHPLILYAYDFHDARSHADRSRADPARFPHRYAFLMALDQNPDDAWVTPTPEAMAESARHSFRERFEMVLEDLAALPGDVPVLAEGWGLRPELIAPLLDDTRRAVFLVPSDGFREQQLRTLPRAGQFEIPGITNPDRAQRNRVERDRLLALDMVASANRLGLCVITVDGSRPVAEIAAMVEAQFRPFLPPWRY
jgi:hypothetical protein